MSFKNVLKIFLIASIFSFVGSNVFAVDYSLNFDGADDDYVSIPDSVELRPTEAITLEAWIYPISFASGTATIYAKGDGGYIYFYIYSPGNEACAEASNLTTTCGVNVITLNKWHHIVVTYDKVNFKLYVNTILVSSVPDTDSLNISSTTSRIGDFPGYDDYKFDGLIDNVKIYNRALTSTEVENSFAGSEITNGLVGYWNFNEGEGSIAYDSSGFGNNGTIVGATFEKKGNILFVSPSIPATALAMVGDLFTDLELVVILAIGLPLAFWVIKKVITLV